MRSQDIQEVALYSYMSPEQRVPADHPLRPIREMVNIVLRKFSREFDKIYSLGGRPSIARSVSCERCCCKYSIRFAVSG